MKSSSDCKERAVITMSTRELGGEGTMSHWLTPKEEVVREMKPEEFVSRVTPRDLRNSKRRKARAISGRDGRYQLGIAVLILVITMSSGDSGLISVTVFSDGTK